MRQYNDCRANQTTNCKAYDKYSGDWIIGVSSAATARWRCITTRPGAVCIRDGCL